MSGSGVSEMIPQQEGARIWIRLRKESYSVEYSDEFEPGIPFAELQKWTEDHIVKIFKVLADETLSKGSVHLDEELCNKQLMQLALWGGRAYKLFFTQRNEQDESEPRAFLRNRIEAVKRTGAIPAPTFISAFTPFPWEVLYEGEDYREPEKEKFWGLAYSPARLLNPRMSNLPHEQSLPSDMLFCLHHRLKHAHKHEWPQIEKLVKATQDDRFMLLSPLGDLLQVSDGEELLGYLDRSSHNMLHFACHCVPGGSEEKLLVSLLNTEIEEIAPRVIELGTLSFIDIERHFSRAPLVFLNACNTSGDRGNAHKVLNLPKLFVDRGAAAVVATACPVPDVFAAEFARVFYELFLRGEKMCDAQTGEERRRTLTIGEALYRARWHFLKEHHNPLGLAYGLYSSALYHVARPPLGGIVS